VRGLRVLVTGPDGFVGRHLIRELHAAGAVTLGAGVGDADDLQASGNLAEWQRCDITDAGSVRSMVALARADAIVHLAGQASATSSFADPIATFRANALGTMHLLEAAWLEAPRARLLVIGTSEIYGPQPPGTRTPEDARLRPVSPYGLSKAAADAAADFYARVRGLQVIRTRSFGHLGPGQDERFAIPEFARQIAAIEAGEGEPVLRVGNLEVTRDLTDVRDVVAAYLALLERGRPGAAYNVCRGEGVELSSIVRFLCEKSRRPVRIEVDRKRLRPADLPYLVGDPAAIQNDTGWGATRSVEAAVLEVLEEWRQRLAKRAS